jgi:hypothetical protein
MNSFHMPTPEAFADLVRERKLDALQAHELGLVLYHVDEDLKQFHRRREGSQPRRELVRRFRRITRIVYDLQFELNRWRKTINDVLPADLRGEIGLLMSYCAMEAALNQEIPTRSLRSEIESLAAEDPDFRMVQIEERLAAHREARGLEHGGEFLMHIIERVSRSAKAFFEIERLNRGGRPPKDLARSYLLIRLTEAAPSIIGGRATATARGRFVLLCAAAVAACGLDDSGIERAVERAIKVVRSRRRAGFRR